MKKPVVVCCAGGFDPLHSGHIAHLRDAKALGDCLIVIINSDANMIKKKGYRFMPELDRIEIIKALRFVDEVVLADEADGTVTETLRRLKPNIFAKGGDRLPSNLPQSEIDACREIGCQIVYGVGGEKYLSSSELVRRASSCNS